MNPMKDVQVIVEAFSSPERTTSSLQKNSSFAFFLEINLAFMDQDPLS